MQITFATTNTLILFRTKLNKVIELYEVIIRGNAVQKKK